jgi:translocation and assembly module TamA
MYAVQQTQSLSVRVLVLLLAAGTFSGCLMRAKAGEAPLVGDIRIEGNKNVPTADIVARLGLATSGRVFIIKIGDAFPFDAELLRVDRQRIERIYRVFGYYEARVVDIRKQLDKGRINITFVVNEGPPTLVGTLQYRGLEGVPEKTRRALLDDAPLTEGGVLSETGYEQLKANLKAKLRDEGYWKATLTGHVFVDEIRRRGTVTIDANTGPLFTISALEVTGTNDVSHRRIREASGLKIGDVLKPSLLTLAERRIGAMGVFSQVSVKVGEFDQDVNEVSVNIFCTDSPFQVFDAGAGIEVDQTRQLARVKTVYTHKNLGRDLERIVVGGSVGYAFVPTLISFFGPKSAENQNGIVADVSAQFLQPRIFHVPIDFSAGVDYSKDIELAFDYQRIGGHAGLIFNIEQVKGLSFTPSVNYDYYFNVSSGIAQPSIPGQQPSAFATSGCGPNAQNQVTTTCRIGYLTAQITWDGRDDPLATRKGFFLSVNAEYASGAVSDFNFLRFSPEARGWLPITKNWVLAARFHYGLLTQLGGGRSPPGVVRFFSGGGNSDRAASEEQLGPREFVVLPNSGKGSQFVAGVPIPVGGDNLIEGNVELRWFTPFISGLVVAAFFDVARLELLYPPAGVTPVPNTSGGFQYAPGLGLRYYSPFGPVRLDFAYRVSTLDSNPVGVDTSNVPSAVKSMVPTTVLKESGAPNYKISTTCNAGQGLAIWQCYADARFQFFITLGEAF